MWRQVARKVEIVRIIMFMVMILGQQWKEQYRACAMALPALRKCLHTKLPLKLNTPHYSLCRVQLQCHSPVPSVFWAKQCWKMHHHRHGRYALHCLPFLTLNIPSLARQRFLSSWGPRRTPWFLRNVSIVWCGRLLKLCFLGFWNYNSVIQVLLASNILCLFISTEVIQ